MNRIKMCKNWSIVKTFIRHHSSKEWLSRQQTDPYVEKAKISSYRCRSAFKLLQMDNRFSILKPGQCVIDIGAAPGSWLQVAASRINSNSTNSKLPNGFLIGIDLQQMYPINGATLLGNSDFTSPKTWQKIKEHLNGRLIDVVLSDMAPNATGVKHLDHDLIIKLAYAVIKFAVMNSNIGATCLIKILDGNQNADIEKTLIKFYSNVKFVKPDASRSDSAEKSMKNCLHIHYYAFNQEFIPDDIDQFAMDFFRDSNVTKTLQPSSCELIGNNVAKVWTKEIPCTVTSMTFFDRLLDPDNGIICSSTDKDGDRTIYQCMEVYKNGMYIANNLKMMLFEDECEKYFLYPEEERSEFMFQLFQHFVTGGKWCQDDITIDPYLNATKYVYKDLLTVEKTTDSKIQVLSKIYKVEAFDSNGRVLFPKENKEFIQYSFAYLAVNVKTRTVALFYHNVGETIYT